MLDESLRARLLRREPFLWLNSGCYGRPEVTPTATVSKQDMIDAALRMERFAGLLCALFPELAASQGIVESPLHRAANLQAAMARNGLPELTRGKWYVKCDHALPIAGSIKARGGMYEVLLHAESLALDAGLIGPDDDRALLASQDARALFMRHQIAVGSTGNLGLSIGVMAAALGFRATVHMSADAKAWKKERLRARGVEVIEHAGDYGEAVAAGRARARMDPRAYFVDDESSVRLFLGYSVAALRLQAQLAACDIAVDAEHPLFVYLPCGVGGAPGGITFGLKQLFGDNVHCFFAEPVESPCMLVQLASGEDTPISVQPLGLNNRTEADGLAVGQASSYVAPLIRHLVSGIFTVTDDDLFRELYRLEQCEGLRIEPSAAAALPGPCHLLHTAAGRDYLARQNLLRSLDRATHLLWTTGGSLVPDTEYRIFHERGRRLQIR